MVHHIVLLKIKRAVAKDALERVMTSIGDLKKSIPGITGYTWGPYKSPEGFNRGYTHGFVMTFTDAKSRDVYLTHPEHEKVKASGVEIIEGGVDGILAFDFES